MDVNICPGVYRWMTRFAQEYIIHFGKHAALMSRSLNAVEHAIAQTDRCNFCLKLMVGDKPACTARRAHHECQLISAIAKSVDLIDKPSRCSHTRPVQLLQYMCQAEELPRRILNTESCQRDAHAFSCL